MQTKRCSRCKEYLPVTLFYKARKWYSAQCHKCTSISRKENYVKKVAKARPRKLVPKCSCGETDPTKFYKNCSSYTGYQFQCKACAEGSRYRRWLSSGELDIEKREKRRNKIRAIFKRWCETGEFNAEL
jgi:hypothetical protein